MIKGERKQNQREQIKLLSKMVADLMNRSNISVNVAQSEGAGFSSCVVKKSAKGEYISFEIKVYSNDIAGATASVSEAIKQARILNSTAL